MSDRGTLAADLAPAPELTFPTDPVEDLVVAFGELRAVDGVSFSVDRAEVFGLLWLDFPVVADSFVAMVGAATRAYPKRFFDLGPQGALS